MAAKADKLIYKFHPKLGKVSLSLYNKVEKRWDPLLCWGDGKGPIFHQHPETTTISLHPKGDVLLKPRKETVVIKVDTSYSRQCYVLTPEPTRSFCYLRLKYRTVTWYE